MTAALAPVIKAVTFLIMVTVGTDLVVDDFRRVLRRTRAIVLPTVGQWLLLPAIAALLIAVLPLPETARLGLILVSVCPGGALSNAHVYLGRGDTALSVSLTAVSTVAATVTMPVLLVVGLTVVGETQTRPDLLWGPVVLTLVGAVLAPALLGMLLRHRWPVLITGWGRRLRAVAAGGVGVLVVLVVVEQGQALVRSLPIGVPLGLTYALLSLVAGRALARVAAAGSAARLAVSVEFVCRNMAVYALVGVPVLGRPDLLACGVVFFLVQVAVGAITGATWHRRTWGVGFAGRARRP